MVPSDAHPGIFDVAVYGVLHDKWREVGKANIVLKDRAIMTAEEVVEFLREKIGKFKIPRYVEFIDGLPRTASGKIKRYLLAEKFKQDETEVAL